MLPLIRKAFKKASARDVSNLIPPPPLFAYLYGQDSKTIREGIVRALSLLRIEESVAWKTADKVIEARRWSPVVELINSIQPPYINGNVISYSRADHIKDLRLLKDFSNLVFSRIGDDLGTLESFEPFLAGGYELEGLSNWALVEIIDDYLVTRTNTLTILANTLTILKIVSVVQNRSGKSVIKHGYPPTNELRKSIWASWSCSWDTQMVIVQAYEEIVTREGERILNL